jgi:hypothetical protein
MHKNPPAGKKTGARNTAPRARRGLPVSAVRGRPASGGAHHPIPHSVKQLLTEGGGLRQLRGRLPDRRAGPHPQPEWSAWLGARLPAELAAHLTAVVRRPLPAPGGAHLVLFADSATWCARLRYALVALEGEIRARDAAIGAIQVRVLMSRRG